MTRTLALLAGLVAAHAAVGCGGDDDPSGPDAGVAPRYTLEVQNPPGESIGLPLTGMATLRVRYRDDEGAAIVGAEVSFRLLTSGSESTGGSSLSAESAITDELGIARVDLVAGAERTNFRVQAEAPSAASALFYVAVSESGFADLQVATRHDGPRSVDDVDSIEVRLFRALELGCADADPDALPSSVFPPRSLPDFDATTLFRNLGAGEAYTIALWSESTTGARLGFGCIDLGAAQIQSGRHISIEVVTSDRPLRLGAPLALATTLDLDAIAADLPGAAMWRALACPLGPAQLALDCLLDAEAPDGALDCVVGGSTAIVADVEAARAPADPDGCRPDAPGLDRSLADALDAGGVALADLAALRAELFASLVLESELTANDAGTTRHRLVRARLSAAGTELSGDLAGAARPVSVVAGVPLAIDAAGDFELGRHGFTLRLGGLLATAFDELALAPSALDGDALGATLVDAISAGGDRGCAALEPMVCSAANLPDGCLAACASLAPALDAGLAAWPGAFDDTGLDFYVSASGVASAADGELDVDAIDPASSQLRAEIAIDGALVETSGTIATP